VSGKDGNSILELLQIEELKGNKDAIDATVLLTKERKEWIEFPNVQGSQESLQVLASNGWGVHAVPAPDEGDGWQLFITQHNIKE
jgi:hypothetical protein